MNSKDHSLRRKGVVVRKSVGIYTVRCRQRLMSCTASNRLRKQLIYPTADPTSVRHVVREVKAIKHEDPVAVGDEVLFNETSEDSGLIIEVLPRRSRLVRRNPYTEQYPGKHMFEDVIVSNVDQVLAVFAAARPAPKWNLLDRYLVSAESLELPVRIVISKVDLILADRGEENRLAQVVDEYRRIGYDVLLSSSVTGQGLEALRQTLSGRLSVLVGKSGVGKSTLLNALDPSLNLRIGQVGAGKIGKGRHTTSSIEMHPLSWGGDVVDTPGIREFGLWGVDERELACFFPEMRSFIGKCRFGLDCRHDEEPGCAIRKAVMDGQISPFRYQSYMQLKRESTL